MCTYALLRELVDTLLSRRAATLDHIKDALLVRHEADDLAHDLAHEFSLLAGALSNTRTNHIKHGLSLVHCDCINGLLLNKYNRPTADIL